MRHYITKAVDIALRTNILSIYPHSTGFDVFHRRHESVICQLSTLHKFRNFFLNFIEHSADVLWPFLANSKSRHADPRTYAHGNVTGINSLFRVSCSHFCIIHKPNSSALCSSVSAFTPVLYQHNGWFIGDKIHKLIYFNTPALLA
jgi:hypothetical protein